MSTSTTTTMTSTKPCPLLRLPLELRQEIYSYLLPDAPLSYPVRTLNIVSVSRRPPPLSLLLVCKHLTADVQSYYFGSATWKFIISHAFNYYRIDPDLSNLACARILKRIQKVELVLFFDGSLLKHYPSFGPEKIFTEVKRRATRFCEVLQTAANLRRVTVSWIDTTISCSDVWVDKAAVLEPLALLKDKVSFEGGELVWPGAPASSSSGRLVGRDPNAGNASLLVAASC